MNDCVLVHGCFKEEQFRDTSGPSPSNRHWFAWLQHELLARDILTQTPEMPRPYAPDYALWSAALDQYTLSADAMLVGHSCGCGFLLRWLGERPEVRLKKLVLVAPSLGLDWSDRSFFDFTIDSALQDRIDDIVLFAADDDRQAIRDASKQIQAVLPKARVLQFETGGHFIFSTLGRAEFPELLEELLR
ncbi:alpha/beta hydrolase [Candidatus Saccharibacteria bacterium]|nr:alpha/beta hydrolase [Candidatus Saccharibacteria bacterium]